MPHWLVIALFAGIVGALSIIVKWEFKRARNAPYNVAVKRYLDSQDSRPRPRATREVKRGFDSWD